VQKVAMLYQGRIIAVESPERLRASTDPVVGQFVNGKTEGPIVTWEGGLR